MREQLVGFLLDALEPEEHEQVKARLSRDPELQRELDLLSRSLLPLVPDKDYHEPPPGLAARTCEFVHRQAAAVSLRMHEPAAAQPRWSMADMAMAAGIFLAAGLLFFPALSQSRFAARVTQCQDQLRQIGMGLSNYSAVHNMSFPHVPLDGPTAAVGIVAVQLREQGYLDEPRLFICPASPQADRAESFRMPSSAELHAAKGPQLVRLHSEMGGSYGFYVGHVVNGKYQTPRNNHRPRFALVADAPSQAAPYHSANHNGCGQNVLFEDMHVRYMTTCKARGCTDNIFLNDQGAVAVGLHPNDAVIGPSPFKPRLVPVQIEKGTPENN